MSRSSSGALAALCLLAGIAYAEDNATVEDRNGDTAKETVHIDGHFLQLAYEGEQDGDSIKEYIPADETLDNWTRLAAVREYADLSDPKEAADGVVAQLKQRTPPANYELLQNSTTGDVVLDFIVWPDDGSFAEFNVFQYRKKDGGGLTMYQYALRGYGDDAEGLVKIMDAEKRAQLIAATVEFAAGTNE